jgi:hypothetical protein
VKAPLSLDVEAFLRAYDNLDGVVEADDGNAAVRLRGLLVFTVGHR